MKNEQRKTVQKCIVKGRRKTLTQHKNKSNWRRMFEDQE
jgi:hypothetical protein